MAPGLKLSRSWGWRPLAPSRILWPSAGCAEASVQTRGGEGDVTGAEGAPPPSRLKQSFSRLGGGGADLREADLRVRLAGQTCGLDLRIRVWAGNRRFALKMEFPACQQKRPKTPSIEVM
jgi:hypothetical protein